MKASVEPLFPGHEFARARLRPTPWAAVIHLEPLDPVRGRIRSAILISRLSDCWTVPITILAV